MNPFPTVRRSLQTILGCDEIAIGFVAEITQIQSAEQSMPVHIIALRPPHQIRHFEWYRAGLRGIGGPLAHVQHTFVQMIGLGVLEQEAVPEPSAQKRSERGQPPFLFQLLTAVM